MAVLNVVTRRTLQQAVEFDSSSEDDDEYEDDDDPASNVHGTTSRFHPTGLGTITEATDGGGSTNRGSPTSDSGGEVVFFTNPATRPLNRRAQR